jgi:hypothetical protein
MSKVDLVVNSARLDYRAVYTSWSALVCSTGAGELPFPNDETVTAGGKAVSKSSAVAN